MGGKQSTPGKGLTAGELVAVREGRQYVKKAKKLLRSCGFPPSGRLQPEEWRRVVREKKGLLTDLGLEKAAQSWYETARAIQREGWLEEEVRDKNGVVSYVYHKGCNTPGKNPSPYMNSSTQEWVCETCDVQNPDWRQTCYNCGAPRPHPPSQPNPLATSVTSSSPTKETSPTAPKRRGPTTPATTPAAPLYPVLTSNDGYYVQNQHPNLIMTSTVSDPEGEGGRSKGKVETKGKYIAID